MECCLNWTAKMPPVETMDSATALGSLPLVLGFYPLLQNLSQFNRSPTNSTTLPLLINQSI